MNISLNWLRDYIQLDVSVEELDEAMTMLGLEIESVKCLSDGMTDIRIGEILEIAPHPDADKIVVCQTDVGHDEPLQICCGAKNMKVGDKVPTAIVGATLPGDFKIGRRKMRGVESAGMMCSARELGMGEDHDGLLILPEDAPKGADALAYLGLDDIVMEIEVTPNRADWASMIGVARELAARFETDFTVPEVELKEDGASVESLTSVTVEDAERCPRYLGRVLTNVTVGPSPMWLAQRLIAAGQRPINNIVDITNYVLLETGQPLHAFDYDKLAENRIVVRTAKAGEKIQTLDDESRALAEDMLVIADAQQPQCIAGVMGGADSEVGEGTTTIFLESAFFLPSSVRGTSRRLALTSESSQRFQRGADPEMAVYALDRAAALIQQLAGASVAQGALDVYPDPFRPREVTLRYARTNQLLGAEITPAAQRDYLERLGFTVNESGDAQAKVTVPLRRHDVSMETDLIEEIARLEGFGNLPSTLPRVHQIEEIFAPEESKLRALRRHLVSAGLSECVNWTFSSTEAVAQSGLGETYTNMVKLENPLSENQATLRSSLLPALLNTAAANIRRGNTRVALFELGSVFTPAQSDTGVAQHMHLAVVLSGDATPTHWDTKKRAFDFYDIKGLLESLYRHLGLTAPDLGDLPESITLLQPGQSAAIAAAKGAGDKSSVDKNIIGRLGARFTDQLDVDQPIYLMELEVDTLIAQIPATPQFQALPPYPKSQRDMAVLVDQSVPAAALVDTALQSKVKNLQEVAIFDIYEGDQIPEGKKSVALSLAFQSHESTLTDKNTQKSFDRLLKLLQSKHGAEMR